MTRAGQSLKCLVHDAAARRVFLFSGKDVNGNPGVIKPLVEKYGGSPFVVGVHHWRGTPLVIEPIDESRGHVKRKVIEPG